MNKHKRIISGLLAFTILFIALFSIFYISTEINHECNGYSCSVCYHINIFKKVLQSLSFVFFSVLLKFFFLLTYFKTKQPTVSFFSFSDLVKLKVKLTN